MVGKRNRSWIWCLFFRLVSCSLDRPTTPGQIVLFGDSITQYSWRNGYASSLADLYQRKLDVINRGYSGWDSFGLLYAAPHVLTSATPIQILVLLIGANDINIRALSNVDAYGQNLESLIDSFFQTRPKPSITVEAPAMILVQPFVRLDKPLERVKLYADKSHQVYTQMHKKYGSALVWVPTYREMIDECQERFEGKFEERIRRFMPDGVHPNAVGYEFLTRQIYNAITRDLSHLLPAALPETMSFWPMARIEEELPPPPEQPTCKRVLFAPFPGEKPSKMITFDREPW